MVVDNIKVRKRSGSLVEFNKEKIYNALFKAFKDSYGKCESHINEIELITSYVENVAIGIVEKTNNPIDVEKIQDIVEIQLMSNKFFDVAKKYILYRNKRSELRLKRLKPDGKLCSDFTTINKYSIYLEDKKRRELYPETVDRTKNMHIKKYPHLKDEIEAAFEYVYDKKIFPSMRSLQYAGKAIEVNNTRMYNCSNSICNRIRFFQEAHYLLLSGVGVGYSVQFEHVEQLPKLADTIDNDKVRHHVIEDSIEGWADSIGELFKSYLNGYYVEFAYSKIRKKGAKLKTAGGKAPGHIPLKKAHDNVRKVLNGAVGRKLRPIECHDIMCHLADSVIAGGNRESAMICLFSIDDLEMVNAKIGDWYPKYPWRQRANNSAVLIRDEVKKNSFKRIFERIKQWGEPGFYFSDHIDIGTNPCVEISMYSVLDINCKMLVDRINEEYGENVKIGDKLYGWQFCNLTEIVAAKAYSEEEFYEFAKNAAFIGTLQAGYTKFPYLGWISEEITRRDALLGVSMTGIMDKPHIALNPSIQEKAAKIVVETNRLIASKIGVNNAVRSTCVKPAGSTSIVAGMCGSGIHPHHAPRYFRRAKCAKNNPIYKYVSDINPGLVEKFKDSDDLVFCVEAPEGAILKEQISAIDFLKNVISTQKNWIMTGTSKENNPLPNVHHNVSNTVSVKDDEWEDMIEFIWKNKEYFTGLSFLSYDGDKKWVRAPYEAVLTPEDEIKWNRIISSYKEVDFSKMVELEDNTDHTNIIACSGNQCELISF